MSHFSTEIAELTEFRYFQIFFEVIVIWLLSEVEQKTFNQDRESSNFYTKEPFYSPNQHFLVDRTTY